MYSNDHVLHCDKPLCGERFTGGQGRTGLNFKAARKAGWHVRPCDCYYRDVGTEDHRWRHRRDYCPAHFPPKPKGIVNLPALLTRFTVY
jgi:hypothetical protein